MRSGTLLFDPRLGAVRLQQVFHCLAGILLCSGLSAQPFLITAGQANTCQGAFLDSGGQGATGYDNDEEETYTLCPGAAGSFISVTFVTFDLSPAGSAPQDNLIIYDGNSTAGTVIGTYTGSALQGQTISASPGNASGCLTFVWHSNETGTGVFAGTIHCYVPCVPPVAAAVMGEPAPARVCPGQLLSFNGSGSTAQIGNTITTWSWDFNDGTTATTNSASTSHAFTTPGVHRVQLMVTDDHGCESVNRLDLQVHVDTEPTFAGTTGPTSGCVGETLCLNGVVNPTPFEDDPQTTYGDGVFIPDDVGSCFEAQLYLTQFTAGATLTNINQLLALCMNFEHTWLGDLVITITSPSGQSVILHQQGIINEVLMGDPIDNDENDPQPGECATYCFATASPNGTMADAANSGGGGGGPNTLPPDTYQSLYPLSGLVGSQLNGLWTLTVCDLWALDNGFLCDWSLDFDPALYSNIIGYTPHFGAGCDSTWWTGPSVIGTEPGCDNICLQHTTAGMFNYVYHAKDNFGCSFDTTLVITIAPPIIANGGVDASLCAGSGIPLAGTVTSGGSPLVPFTYTWSPALGLTNTGVANPTAQPTDTTTYTLVVSQAGHPACAGTDEVTINVVPLASAGIDGSTTLCNTDVPLDLLSLLGASASDGGLWTAPTGTPHANTIQPDIDPAGIYTYTVPAIAPCTSAASSTVTVSINTLPDAGDDGTLTVCSDGTSINLFTLLGGAPDTNGSWTAPNGNGSTSNYAPGTSEAGVYTYTVNGTAPCANDAAAVTITQHDPVNAGSDGTATPCTYAPLLDLFSVLGGTPDPGGVWTAANGTAVANVFDPAAQQPGTFNYRVDGTAPCVDASANVVVIVDRPLAAVNARSDATCNGWCDGEVAIERSGGVLPIITTWSSGIATSSDTNATGLCADSYFVAIEDALGCRDTAAFTIDQPPPLVIDLLDLTDERCVGNCDGQVAALDGEGVLFSIDEGVSWTVGNVFDALCPGTYTIGMRDNDGCEATTNGTINAAIPTVAAFDVPTEAMNVTNSTAHFINQSSNAVTYAWDFAGYGASEETDPSFTFPDVLGGEYEVCLRATSVNGCMDSVCHPVVVLERLYVHVPNAFSPNGDGINDGFSAVLNIPSYAEYYELSVYDRWGEMIFTSNTIGQSWNGQLNGADVPPEVYVWKLHCRDAIAQEAIDRTGHVTVVR